MSYLRSPGSDRIAIVTETYPPEVNGVARSLERIVEGLRRRNRDIQLIRPRQHIDDNPRRGSGFQELLIKGLPVPGYPGLRMGAPAGRALRRMWSLARPNIVHIATEGPLGWSALWAASKLNLPISSDFRTDFAHYSAHYRLGRLATPIAAALRHFHNKTNCTMVPTESLRKQLLAEGYHRLAVVGRGVDTELFNPKWRSRELRATWGASDSTLIITCVGRLAAEKNLELVVETYHAIAQSRPDTRLVFVGDGPIRDALRTRCPRAVFAGAHTGTELSAHYASADMFLFPSLSETFGNVTTEAMASGLPVIAFDRAAAGELIRHGGSGMLAPCGDRAAFVNSAKALADDELLRSVIADGALRRAQQLGWKRVVDRFEWVLTESSTPKSGLAGIENQPAAAEPASQAEPTWI
jgi:glycosyltransferase involved in cell wall biosynthesis